VATDEPTIQTVDAGDVQHSWSQLLEAVSQSHDRVIVEEGGKPVAAIISAADLARLKRLDQQDERDSALIERMEAAFEGVPFEEIEREAAKALAEVRAEMRLERQAAKERR
jgi:prevent-host-death family protein